MAVERTGKARRGEVKQRGEMRKETRRGGTWSKERDGGFFRENLIGSGIIIKNNSDKKSMFYIDLEIINEFR